LVAAADNKYVTKKVSQNQAVNNGRANIKKIEVPYQKKTRILMCTPKRAKNRHSILISKENKKSNVYTKSSSIK